MSQHIKTPYLIPIPTSVGSIRTRSLTVTVTPTAFPRTFDDVTKWYRTLTVTTAYAGMERDNPAPTPDVTYSVTPAVSTQSVERGWSVVTTTNPGETELDLDADPTSEFDPAVWTPPLVGSPTWGPVTETETETTYVETRTATGSWSGTQTVTQVWSDEITDEQLVGALEEARDAATFAPGPGNLGSPGFPQYRADSEVGDYTLTVVDYSLGTYTGRTSIAAIALPILSFDFADSVAGEPTLFATTATEVVTIPSGVFAGQESFRDDSKQLFGPWRRYDVHEAYPAARNVSGSLGFIPLSGHAFINEATATLVNTLAAAYLGTTSPPVPGFGAFIHAAGHYTPPADP